MKGAVANGITATYMAVIPHYGPTIASRTYAMQQPNWRYIEITAGHDAMVTSPQAVVDILLGV